VKVLDVTEFFSEHGGVRGYLELKGQALRKRGHRQLVIAPGRSQDSRQGEVEFVESPALPYDSTYFLLARIDRVAARVLDERPDVLELHSAYMAMAAAFYTPRGAYGLRTLFWHADFVDTYLKERLERWMPFGAGRAATRSLWAGVRALAARCDATLVAGRHQFEKLRSHGLSRLYLLPFGVNKEIFHPGAQFRARSAEPPERRDRLRVVAAGRFAVEKRFDVVVGAFRRIAERRPATLLLYGEGPEQADLERRAAGLDLRFCGFERDKGVLAAAFADADLLLHGCPHETFGLVVAEARACGVPVVVPDAGGAGEGADPACSERYRAGDPEACAAAAERLLQRDPAELRAQAIESAARVTSVDEHFEALLAVYQELLDARAARSARSPAGDPRVGLEPVPE
jgi:alpha-1,6-mannosyltransferase